MKSSIIQTTTTDKNILLHSAVSALMEGGNQHVSSREIAKIFDKRHDHVLRDIRNIGLACKKIKSSGDFFQRNYREVYEAAQMPNGGIRYYPVIEMTRDGFMMLVFGFNGRKAARVKEAIIAKFNEMEKQLLENRSARPQLEGSQFIDALHKYIQELESKEHSLQCFA